MDAAEVVDANRVEEFQVVTDARLPPSKAVGGVTVPRIERIAPQLAVRGKVVGRHAGDGERASGFVQLEEFGARLGIAAVGRDVDGFVTEETDALAVRIFAKRAPLLGEKELEDLGFRDQAGGGFVDCPFIWCGEAVGFAQGGESTPGIEPSGVFGSEALESGVLF